VPPSQVVDVNSVYPRNRRQRKTATATNIYTGNVTTDSEGHATVQMPEWFQVLNTDFRYQLTVIGQFAHAIVAHEIENNRFEIGTSAPNVKVSWQVTGVRQDACAKAHPLVVIRSRQHSWSDQRDHRIRLRIVKLPLFDQKNMEQADIEQINADDAGEEPTIPLRSWF
jgi:hypothetical protein